MVTIEEKRAVIQDRRIKAIAQEQAAIDRLIASQQFFTKLAGGSTALQNSVIPAAEKSSKTTTSTAPTQRDAEAARMTAMNADFQQKKGKNWWRDTQTVQSGNTQIVDLSLIHISEPTRHFKRSRMPSSA